MLYLKILLATFWIFAFVLRVPRIWVHVCKNKRKKSSQLVKRICIERKYHWILLCVSFFVCFFIPIQFDFFLPLHRYIRVWFETFAFGDSSTMAMAQLMNNVFTDGDVKREWRNADRVTIFGILHRAWCSAFNRISLPHNRFSAGFVKKHVYFSSLFFARCSLCHCE